MGYENAYDYEGGKRDWIEADLVKGRVDDERERALYVSRAIVRPLAEGSTMAG